MAQLLPQFQFKKLAIALEVADKVGESKWPKKKRVRPYTTFGLNPTNSSSGCNVNSCVANLVCAVARADNQ